MKSANTKKLKLLKGEKIMYLLLMLLIVIIPVVNIFIQGMLSETNIKREELEFKIASQKQVNESLSMQVNELTSLQNIQAVAETYNLTHVNGNIKDIESE